MTVTRARPGPPGVITMLALHLVILPTGASQALYGPSLPAVADRFDVVVSTAGLLIGAHGLGAALGITAWAVLQRRLGMRVFATLSAIALGAGCLLLSLAPTWPVMVAGAALTGSGFGGNASGLNVYVSRMLEERSAPVLTSLAAVFGLGSILAPALLGWVGLEAHQLVFAAVGVVALVASPLLLAGADVSPAPPTPRGDRRPNAVAVLFMTSLALYVALEVGVGGWAATHLIAEGMDPKVAARWTAAFWGAFTVGRFLATPLALRVRPRTMAVASLALGAVSLGLATVSRLSAIAYVLAGLALAPFFPALFAWYARVAGTASYTAALFFLAGSVGAAALPPLIGVLAGLTGARAIPVSLAVVAAIGAAMLVRLRQMTGDEATAAELSGAGARERA